MNIQVFYLGNMMTNCYLTWNEKNEGYLFDCGGENLDRVVDFIKMRNINLKYMILTHGHGDHLGGLNKIVELFPDVKVYIGKEDEEFLFKNELNLMSYIDGKYFSYQGDYQTLKGGDKIGDFVVIDTPGHTVGSKCFYCAEAKMLISGDTMFRRSFGRTDLPTGSEGDMFRSLGKLCDMLPDDTKVYSAHTEPTTIGEEKLFLRRNGLI